MPGMYPATVRGQIVSRLRSGEEIAAELGVSPATLYNWRRTYGGMDTDAAKELKELREQTARLKPLLAEAELVKGALREVAEASVTAAGARGEHRQVNRAAVTSTKRAVQRTSTSCRLGVNAIGPRSRGCGQLVQPRC